MVSVSGEARAAALADRDVSLLARDQYFREVAWTEPLEEGEREKLFARLARAYREPENAWLASLARYARDRLVEVYQPLVISVATRHVGCFVHLELEDLLQECNLALLAALERFVACGTIEAFAPFAVTFLVQALYSARRDRDQAIRRPAGVYSLLSKARVARRELRKALGAEPSLSQVAQRVQVSEHVLVEALAREQSRQVQSLHALLGEDGHEDRHEWVSLFAATGRSCEQPQTGVSQVLEQALERVLTPRERHVMRVRCGVGEPPGPVCSCEAVAQMVGVSAQTVRVVESKAVQGLRDALVVQEGGSVWSCQLRADYQEEYYTLAEVAQRLGCSQSTIHFWLSEGRLRCVRRAGHQVKLLFPKQQIEALVALRGAEQEQYYTAAEVAQRLGCSRSNVRMLAAQGRLPVVRREGRQVKLLFPKQEIDALVASRAADRRVV